jgi:DNA-binding NtrC family response regulator
MRHLPVVLVIEDQNELLDVIRDVFDDEGYDVATVRNPDEALEVLRAKSVDLLVSDYAPPSDDGSDPLVDVVEEFPELPIIVFSEDDEQSIPFFGPWRTEGTKMTMRKPFKLDDLIAASHEVVG